jgi:hypothetical protein
MISGRRILIFVGTFFVLLASAYFIDNPLSRASTVVNFPYILSVKPITITPTQSTNISYSSPDNITILIIDPDGQNFRPHSSIQKMGSLQFPTNFSSASNVNASSALRGNYTVIMISNASNTAKNLLASVHFSAVSNPWFSSFTDFLFGKGLALTIGGIAVFIPLIYQYASQMREDYTRRLGVKSNWIVKNSKDYWNLAGASADIYHLFMDTDVDDVDRFLPSKYNYTYSDDNNDSPYILLYYIIKYYNVHEEFDEHDVTYYFDDIRVELFLGQLESKIESEIESIVLGVPVNRLDTASIANNEWNEFRKHSKDLTLFEVTSAVNCHTETYAANIKQWLKRSEQSKNENHEDPVKIFFLNHLVCYWIFAVNINKELLVSYSQAPREKKVLQDMIEIYRPEITNRINELNNKFYNGKTTLHYNMFDSKGKLTI